MKLSIPGIPVSFNLDMDTVHKAVAIVISAAATAAITAGGQALIDFLSKDPKYAVYAAIVTMLVSSFSRRHAADAPATPTP